MKRNTPFSYTCNQCNRCCNKKFIKLNPYEVTRLAHNRRMTTTEFIRTYTVASGTGLKMEDNGNCVFLTSKGCGVHADRPLVCRLYPLGRHVNSEGEESFSELSLHPQSEGVRGQDGSIADYLAVQGTELFIDFARRYLEILKHMLVALRRIDTSGDSLSKFVNKPVNFGHNEQTALEWLDVDFVGEEYCKKNSLTWPDDPFEKIEIHIRALGAWIQNLTRENDYAKAKKG